MHLVNLKFDEVEIIVLGQHVRDLHQEVPIAGSLQFTSIIHLGSNQHFLHAVVVFLLQTQSCILRFFQHVFECFYRCLQKVIIIVAH
jgi:hypothetical protein